MKVRAISLATLLWALSATGGFADILELQFEARPFDDKTYLIRYDESLVEFVEGGQSGSQPYDYAFRSPRGDYEIRYILCSQKGAIEDYETQVTMWSTLVCANCTGLDPDPSQLKEFGSQDVKREFNADYGLTFASNRGKTDFTKGHDYLMLNFFYKKGLGIMCQAILFNELSWVQTQQFDAAFHWFSFK